MDIDVKATAHPSLQAPQICFRGRQVLLLREKERYIDWNALEGRFFDGICSDRRTRNLDEEIRPFGLLMKLPGCDDRSLDVVGQEGGHFQGHEAIKTTGLPVHRREQVGSSDQIVQGEFKEE